MKKSVIFVFAFVVFFFAFSLADSVTISDFSTSINNNITLENNFTHLNISTTSPYDTLEFYLPFDKNVSGGATHDFSNNDRDSTSIDAVYKDDCLYGGCYEFSSASSDDMSGSATWLNSYPFTVSLWYNSSDTSDTGTIFGLTRSSYNNVYWMLQKIDTDKVRLYALNGLDGPASVTSTDVVTDGEWHHIVAVFAGNTVKYLYVDGVYQGNANTNVPWSSSVDKWGVGYLPRYSPINYMNGQVDEVMLFKKSLNQTEIDDIYNNQSARFVVSGTQSFEQNITLDGYDGVNITSQYQSNFDNLLNLSVSYYNGSDWIFTGSQFVNSSVPNQYSIPEDSSNITLNYTFTSGLYYFYTSLLLNDITILPLDLIYPLIEYVNPTPENNSGRSGSFEINVTIDDLNLKDVVYNWNGTNYTLFDDSVVLMMNMNNFSALGENDTRIFDVSGAGNNGSVVGAVFNSTGKHGGAYYFGGDGDYVDLGTNLYNLGIRRNATISFWMYPISGTSSSGAISDYSSLNGFNIRYETTDNVLTFYVYPNNHRITINNGAVPNQWQHIVGVMAGDYMYLYNNGVEIGSTTLGEDIGNSVTTMKLSARGDLVESNYQRGSIDDLIIFNRSLSAGEISHLYGSSLVRYNSTYWTFYKNQTSPEGGDSATYYVSSVDISNNINSTEVRLILGNEGPEINSVSYTPTDLAELDPNVVINITVNLSDSEDNFDSAMIQWKNSTQDYGVNNVSLSNLSEIVTSGTLFNANFQITDEGNYSFRVFANDTVGSTTAGSDYNLSVFWDCTWETGTDDLGATAGYNQNKNIGNITIINTGDSNYSNNNCSLDFRVSYSLPQGRIYYDNEYVKNVVFYTIDAGENDTILINATYDTEIKQELVNITLEEFRDRSNLSQSNVSATIVTNQEGPYLYHSITSSPTSIYLTTGNFDLNGYVRNLMGSIIENATNIAFNVTSNWTVPSVFTNSSGALSVVYENISNNSLVYNNLNLTFVDLESMSPSSYDFNLTSYGYNSSGDLIEDANNNTFLSESVSFTFLCYNVSDGVCVTSCGYLLDSDCEQEVVTTAGGGSGGGGGGGGSLQKLSNFSFELLRGEEQFFSLEFENNFDFTLKNIIIEVVGLNSRYISVRPLNVASLSPGQIVNYSVFINTPSYFSKNTYDLNFKIRGEIYNNGTFTQKYYNENKRVRLYLVEVRGSDAVRFLNESEIFFEEMNDSGMILDKVSVLLDRAKSSYDEVNFLEVKNLYEEIKEIYESAFASKDMLVELDDLINGAERDGIDVTETKKLFYLSENAYRRGDYVLAFERLSEAKLTYALETKGEFNIIYKIKNNPLESLGIFFGFLVFSLGSSYGVRIKLYKNKLKLLEEEEKILLELMKVVQRECFEKTTMSMEEYDLAMSQYEHRLSDVIEEKIAIETRLFNLLKFKGRKKSLENEKKKLLNLMKDVQEDYLNNGKMETRVYDNMIQTYTSRLTKVEEELTFLEAKALLGGSGRKRKKSQEKKKK